jgi:hypothetical protein
MTLEQLEQRVRSLEEQVAELRRQLKPLLPMGSKIADNPAIQAMVRSDQVHEDRRDRDAE